MMGKLLVHRPTRDEAIRTMLRALDEFVIEGRQDHDPAPATRSSTTPTSAAGGHDTGFVERYFGGQRATAVESSSAMVRTLRRGLVTPREVP